MYLSEFHLNARRSGGRKLLCSPQAMHAAILSAFPPTETPVRPLWRIDAEHDPLRPAVLVVSDQRPDFTHIEEQGGWPSQPTARHARYDHFLENLSVGQKWAFRLQANPTHRAKFNDSWKIVAHVTAQQQLQWLLDRDASLGISLSNGDEATARVIGRQVQRFSRKGKRVTIGTARFEGVLTVTDANLFRQALTHGIGRAKAYGCGLMTLAQP